MSGVVVLRRDFVGELPFELSLQILQYLTPAECCQYSQVSRTWQRALEDDSLWRRLCSQVWKGKLIFPSPFLGGDDRQAAVLLSPKGDYSHCAKSFTIKDIKSVLERRGVSITAFVEKGEFVAALVSSTPPTSPRLGIAAKWKAAFAAEIIDSRRLSVTWEELVRLEWQVVFLNHRFYYGQTPRIAGTFGKDYTWTSELGTHPWCFFSDNAVQIGEFPPLYAKRTKNTWSWHLTNDHVRLEPKK